MLGDHKLVATKSSKSNASIKSCYKCTFSTKYPGELIRHEFYKHGDGISLVFNADIEKMYTCEICNYQTPKMSNIKTNHYNTLDSIYKFFCDIEDDFTRIPVCSALAFV